MVRAKLSKTLKKLFLKMEKVFCKGSDREGEAIALHLNSVLKSKNVTRVTFKRDNKECGIKP
jgi:DNA topoisomerase IA